MSFSPLPNVGIFPHLKARYDSNKNEYKPIEEHATSWLSNWVENDAPPYTQQGYEQLMRPSVGRPDYRQLALYLAKNATPENCERKVLHDRRRQLQRAIEKRLENRDIWVDSGGILDVGHKERYLTLAVMRDEFGLALEAYDHQVASELEAQNARAQTAPPTFSRTEGIWAVVNSTERKRKQADTEEALQDQEKSKRKTQVTGFEQESLENPASDGADVDDAEPEQDKPELLETDGAEQKEIEREHAVRQEADEYEIKDEQDREEPLHEDQVEQGEVDEEEVKANQRDEEEVDDGRLDDDQGNDGQVDDDQVDEDQLDQEQTNGGEMEQEQSKQQQEKVHSIAWKSKKDKQKKREERPLKIFVDKQTAKVQHENQRQKGKKARQKTKKREEKEQEAAEEEAKRQREEAKRQEEEEEKAAKLKATEAELKRKQKEHRQELVVGCFTSFIVGAVVAGIFLLNKHYSFPQ